MSSLYESANVHDDCRRMVRRNPGGAGSFVGPSRYPQSPHNRGCPQHQLYPQHRGCPQQHRGHPPQGRGTLDSGTESFRAAHPFAARSGCHPDPGRLISNRYGTRAPNTGLNSAFPPSAVTTVPIGPGGIRLPPSRPPPAPAAAGCHPASFRRPALSVPFSHGPGNINAMQRLREKCGFEVPSRWPATPLRDSVSLWQ